MTSSISPRLLARAAAMTLLVLTLGAAELFAQPPAPAQPAARPAQPGAPAPAPPAITPGQPSTPAAPASPTPPTTTTPSPSTPTNPSEPTPGTATTPTTAPNAGTAAATPRVLTNEMPKPGEIGPPIIMTGCVKRIERLDTDSATVADVINRPMTAYVLEPSGGKVDDQRRVTGLISANEGVRFDSVVGKAVQVSGTLRPPMAIGSPTKGADTPQVTEIQPMIVRTLKPASAQCK